MNKTRLLRLHQAGMTLVEVMVAATVTAIVFGALTTASIQLQRSFASDRDYSKGAANQMIVSDYLALDLRRALTVVSLGTNAATLKIPDYYTDGKTRRDPTVALVTQANSRIFKVYYGASATAAVQVRYYKTGTTIFREEGTRGALAIADNVNFDVAYPKIDDPDNPGFLIDDTRRASISVKFIPLVKRKGMADLDRQTYLFNTVMLRNTAN